MMNYFTVKVGLLIAVLSLFCCSGAVADFPNGVASGDTTQTTTVLWARSTIPGELIFELALDSTLSTPVGLYQAIVVDSQIPVKLELDKLSPGTLYFYRITDAANQAIIGRFHTAASPGSRAGIRFGVSGDWRGELLPFSSIRNAKDRALDFFIKLGDTIYADVPSPALNKSQALTLEDFYSKHAEVYSKKAGLNSWADLQATTSIWATIDDHEVTDNFIGYADVVTDARFSADPPGTYINESTLYKNGMQAFLDYNPIKPLTYDYANNDPRTEGKVKLYRYQTYGDDAALMLLDSRSFRDAGITGYVKPLSTNTLLGRRQLSELKNDLLDAENQGVTWKFVAIPEPIQNLGGLGAEDRYEGFAGERAELLQFIAGHDIRNVVFISADIHGTLINNLAYQSIAARGLKQHATSAWEISSGAVAYFEPLGPTIIRLAKDSGFPGVLSPDKFAHFNQAKQESYVLSLVNLLLLLGGYDTIGLNDSEIDATLLFGGYSATTTYGWTEFYVEPDTQILTVTVWGINAYSMPLTSADLAEIADQQPRIISQFSVNPRPLKLVSNQQPNITTKIVASRKTVRVNQKIKYTASLRKTGQGSIKNAVLNFHILENTADVVRMGKKCRRFGQVISCNLGNVKKKAVRSIVLKPLNEGGLKIGVDLMASSIKSNLMPMATVSTPIR